MQPATLFLSAFFLYALSSQALSIGVVVGIAASFSEPIGKTAFVVALQAVAGIGAVLLSRSTYLRHFAPRTTLFLSLPWLSLAVASFSPLTAPWLISVTLRWTFGFYAIACLTAAIREIFQNDFLLRNKQAQFLSTGAAAFAISLSPLIVLSFGIAPLFYSDFIFQFLGIAFLFSLWRRHLHGLQHSQSMKTAGGKYCFAASQFLNHPALVAGILVWAIAGTFMIIEVPLLRERFNAGPEVISLFFLVSLAMNLLATVSIPVAWMDRLAFWIQLGSGAVMILASILYVHSFSLLLSIAAVILFGLGNGAFNLAQSSCLQRIPEDDARTFSFVLLRLYVNFGMLLGAGIVFLGERMNVGFVLPVSGAGVLGVLLLIALAFNRDGESYAAQLV